MPFRILNPGDETMTARLPHLAALLLFLLTVAACSGSKETPPSATDQQVSGKMEGGLRVLTVDPSAASHHYLIFRGDYIRIQLASGEPFTIEIPGLEVSKTYPAPEGDKPYIKVPDAGSFPFTIGDVSGVIEALEFRAEAYREVDSREASELIANLKPFILDVRTSGEFAGGHIEGATLIPISELQKRLGELKGREKEPLFVYCRSGNRSTVAGRFLVDAGFEQIINLRRGIVEWSRAGYPVVK